MKKYILALSVWVALVASPAIAGDGTRIHVGFYTPEPLYYQPPPVFYAPPVAYYGPSRFVRYEPPCPKRYARAYRHSYRHDVRHERRFESAWNDRDHYRDHGWRH